MCTWFMTFFLLLSVVVFVEGITDCQVMVHQPWPIPYVFVPRDSSVNINCVAASDTNDLFWEINLNNHALRFSTTGENTTLNGHGVYELPPIETPGTPPTLRLLINDTARNNGTMINCRSGATSISHAMMFVLDLNPVTLEVKNLDDNVINISWSQDSRSEAVSDAVQTFSLSVSHGSSSQVISLNDSYYNFTALEDAPRCEVYNFSVTATYVGATYTGAGCSTPGSKSTMLPSLPEILSLESSLEYVLVKTSSKIVLVISFEPSSYCEQYPVLDYKLEIKGPSSDVRNQSVLPRMENIIHNLTENAIYSFSVLVSNSIGVVSTNSRHIFTTDVQNVTATPVESMNAVVVQCVFITDSNAQGCMVVLMSDFGNSTCVLNRIDPCVLEFFNTTDPFIVSFCKLFAFDIESDGSIGTLAVPGVIMSRNESETALCPITTTTITRDLSSVRIIAIGCGVAIATIVLIVLAIIIFCICCKLIKRSKKLLTLVQPSNNVYLDEPETIISESGHCTNERLESEAAEILYDQPVKALGRCSGDGAEYDKTKHIKSLEDAIDERDMDTCTYAELAEEDHHYHTLEPQRLPQGIEVDAVALPPPYRPPSTFPQPPLYQEIGSLQVVKYDQRRECTRGEIVDIQLLNQSSTHGHLSHPPPGGIQLMSETLL